VVRLGKAPLLTAAGGVLLAVALFLPWYEVFAGWTFYAPVDPSDIPPAKVIEHQNAWQSFRFADVLMALGAAGALAATVLAARISHGFGWLAVTVAGCGLIAGVVYSLLRPSPPAGAPDYGFFVALFGAALIASGGVLGTAAADRA
jgi:hypothetical protein